MKHSPKPIVYADTVFRSRLEASWAAFFDLAGWSWRYEPYDLDGWTPDFLIEGAYPLLVEVKAIDWNTDLEMVIWRHYDELAKAIKHAPDCENWGDGEAPEVVILGNGPAAQMIGAFVTRDKEATFHADAAMLWKGYGPAFDVCAHCGWFGYRVGGQADGDHHLQEFDHYNAPRDTWRRARALTQWKKPMAPPPEFMPAGRAMTDLVRKLKPEAE